MIPTTRTDFCTDNGVTVNGKGKKREQIVLSVLTAAGE